MLQRTLQSLTVAVEVQELAVVVALTDDGLETEAVVPWVWLEDSECSSSSSFLGRSSSEDFDL